MKIKFWLIAFIILPSTFLLSKNVCKIECFQGKTKSFDLLFECVGNGGANYNYLVITLANGKTHTYSIIDKLKNEINSQMTAQAISFDVKNNSIIIVIQDTLNKRNVAIAKFDNSNSKVILEEYNAEYSNVNSNIQLSDIITISSNKQELILSKTKDCAIKNIIIADTKGEIIFQANEDFIHQKKIDIENISDGIYLIIVKTSEYIASQAYPIIK